MEPCRAARQQHSPAGTCLGRKGTSNASASHAQTIYSQPGPCVLQLFLTGIQQPLPPYILIHSVKVFFRHYFPTPEFYLLHPAASLMLFPLHSTPHQCSLWASTRLRVGWGHEEWGKQAVKSWRCFPFCFFCAGSNYRNATPKPPSLKNFIGYKGRSPSAQRHVVPAKAAPQPHAEVPGDVWSRLVPSSKALRQGERRGGRPTAGCACLPAGRGLCHTPLTIRE